MSTTTKVTDADRLIDLLYRLRPGDVTEYEGSGGGRTGPVTVHVSEVGERNGTYCVFGEGEQDGEYALFPEGRPSGRKYESPEACYIRGGREATLSNMGLYTHGTILWMRIDSKVMDRSHDP